MGFGVGCPGNLAFDLTPVLPRWRGINKLRFCLFCGNGRRVSGTSVCVLIMRVFAGARLILYFRAAEEFWGVEYFFEGSGGASAKEPQPA